MKPQIFLVQVDNNLDKETFHYLMQFVNKEKQDRILRQKKKENANAILIADILVKYALKKVFNLDITKIKIGYGDLNKPFLVDYPDIHFNVSHSGNMVVCAVYDKPIGIDIQINQYCPNIFIDKVCNKDEILKIEMSEDRISEFIKIWTQKEAVMKKTGQGINGDLKNCLVNEGVQSCKIKNYWLSISV